MRLIDADVLLKDIKDNSQSYFADDFAKEWVDRQPTVHPAQPKIGKWGNRNLRDTELGMATYTDDCSVCKLPAIRLIEGDGWKWEFFYQFCPNCGAKMEAGDE